MTPEQEAARIAEEERKKIEAENEKAEKKRLAIEAQKKVSNRSNTHNVACNSIIIITRNRSH